MPCPTPSHDPGMNAQAIARVKDAAGIKCANCSTCAYLGSDNDGGEPEYSKSWPTCEKFERYQYLKSFPFKKEMHCWWPEFWQSKFTDEIKTASHSEVMRLIKKFRKAVDAAEFTPCTPPTVGTPSPAATSAAR